MSLLLSVSAVSLHLISAVKSRLANFIINIKLTDLQYHVCVHLLMFILEITGRCHLLILCK